MTNQDIANAFICSSKQFLEASKRSDETVFRDGKFVSAPIPSVVCLVFSIELALKALYIVDHDRLPKKKIHDLDKLYEGLKESTKESINSYNVLPGYPIYSESHKNTLVSYLQDHSRSFVSWRYFGEEEGRLTAHTGFLRKFAECAIQLAESHGGNFLKHAQHMRIN